MVLIWLLFSAFPFSGDERSSRLSCLTDMVTSWASWTTMILSKHLPYLTKPKLTETCFGVWVFFS